MNRSIILLCGLFIAVCMPLFGQSRDFQTQRLVLDDDGTDGVRNTMTIQSPSTLTLNTVISIPDPGFPGASLLLTESLVPQTVNASITFDGVVDFTTATVVGLNSLADGATLLGTGVPLNSFRMNMAHPNNWVAKQSFSSAAIGTLELDNLTQDNTLGDILVVDAGGVVQTRSVASIGGGGGGTAWSLSGNGGTTAGTNFLGTTDNVALVVKTNNSERIRVLGTGEVGIGAGTPSQKLELRDGNLLLSNSGSAGELRFAEPGGTDYTAFRATAQTATVTYTLPPADGIDGNVLSTDGSGVLTWVNPNQSGSVGSELFASKAGDETITNVGTLQNDDHLTLAVEASTTYSVEGFLYVKGNSNNAEFIMGFDVPTGSAMKLTYVAYDGANNIKGGGFLSTDGAASAAIDVSTSATTNIAIWFRGIVRVSTTSGNLQLLWAQSAPAADRSTTVEVDSFMEAKRVQ